MSSPTTDVRTDVRSGRTGLMQEGGDSSDHGGIAAFCAGTVRLDSEGSYDAPDRIAACGPRHLRRYEPCGTNTDAKDRPLTASTRKPLPHLTDDERAVYERVTDPNCTGHRRIEQEHIPLDCARVHVTSRSPSDAAQVSVRSGTITT